MQREQNAPYCWGCSGSLSQAVEHHTTTRFTRISQLWYIQVQGIMALLQIWSSLDDTVTQQHATKHLLLCRVCLAVASRKVSAMALVFLHKISLDGPTVIADRGGARLLLF